MSEDRSPKRHGTDWWARVFAGLGLALGGYSAVVTSRGQSIQEYNAAPVIKFIDERSDQLHPIVQTPGPARDAVMKLFQQSHQLPRWLVYDGRIKNAGSRTITVWTVLLCIRDGAGEASDGCRGNYGLTGGTGDITLEPGEEWSVNFDCGRFIRDDSSDPDCFFGIEKADIFIVVRVRSVGEDLVSFQHHIAGFDGNMQVMSLELRG